ncbi:tetratricopeptide repeat protein [Erythrobacter litoralis]|uniref:tetratricopeptide repeat protein n=1 Tax=Erythrobacter litoralis TaxID=39960 RepID=UPI0024350DCA|nr:tetratricopeptide repeat protein [Erythrobacter litoralis]MDG6077820.1 tetratricopeptide repeat protein [Erythrobacter litoralis]
MFARTFRRFAVGTLAGALAVTAIPAGAQDADQSARIRKLEAEVSALQRKVFPGGSGRFFEPEITAPQQNQPATNTVTTSALTDVLARLDALESQLQRLTAQYEEGSNTVRLLQERVDALEAGGAGPAAIPQPASGSVQPSGPLPVSANQQPSTPAPAAQPSPQRLAAVQQITKPQTGDTGDDEYSYGFRLWDAGFFPEAQQQLTMFVEQYPNHSRASFGRNLLGRAYLDDGKPSEAAPWFLKNYQENKNGARAGDSLLYLAEAMIALNDTSRACIALAEFSETYPALAAGRLQNEYQANRGKVSCS